MSTYAPDQQRYRHGQTRSIVAAAPLAATTIRVGDLIAKTITGGATEAPLSAENYGAIPGDFATLAVAQEAFHDRFLGHASQRYLPASAGIPIGAPNASDGVRTNTRGVHEFECASATFDAGDLVGPAANAGGTALESQKVVLVATENLAIGRVVKTYAAVTTLVLVEIVGTVTHGGPQVMA